MVRRNRLVAGRETRLPAVPGGSSFKPCGTAVVAGRETRLPAVPRGFSFKPCGTAVMARLETCLPAVPRGLSFKPCGTALVAGLETRLPALPRVDHLVRAAETCAEGEVLCGDTCADLATDRQNCGACGVTCGTAQVCVSGICS